MSTNEVFWAFFDGPWQGMLEATEIPGDNGVSWDRKAAWLYFNKEGTNIMARGRKKAGNEIAAKLLEVMTFLEVGHKTSGNLQANTTVFYGGWAFSFDGVIAAGSPTIQGFNFDGAVHTALFKEALARVGKEMELTISDTGAHFSSDEFEAVVPVVPLSELLPIKADASIAPFPLGVNFVAALDLAGRVIRDSSENVRDAAILLYNDTVIATNGTVLVQAWHGNSMPTGQLFPKAFATALQKVGREPKSFGFSNETFTVYYEDGSFIRTQIYPPSAYPIDVVTGALNNLLTAPMAIPPVKGLFDAMEKVAPFADEERGLIWFTGGSVKTGAANTHNWTSEVDVKDLPEGVGVNGKGMLMFKDGAKSIWLGDPSGTDQARAVILGDTFRAAVIGVRLNMPTAPVPPAAPVPPSAPDWGSGQTSETPPAPPGWGTVGAPTSEAPAAPSASVTTAPDTGWGQPVQASAEVSHSDTPFAIASFAQVEGSAPTSAPVPTQAPEGVQAPSWANAASPSNVPAPGQEPSLRGAPGWDNVRAAAAEADAGAWGSPGFWGASVTDTE